MKELDPGYAAEVDLIDKPAWHAVLPDFDDATFYQTWSYGEKSWGASNLSHLLLRHDGRIVALAQLRIVRFPLLKGGAAYLNWGPLWQARGMDPNRTHLRNALRALRNEYVHARGLSLRTLPKSFDVPENEGLARVYADEGYVHGPDTLRTFVVDLLPSIEEIRQNLHKSWKGSLKFAEKQDLEILAAVTGDHFAAVADINREMKDRKQYFGADIPKLLEIDRDLPDALKLKILLCRHEEEVIAALGWSNIGKVSFPLVGGTGDKALQFKASFLLFWRMVQHSKENGFRYCDTAGVHEKRNPGGHFFKKGLAGKDARETTYIGRFDAYRSLPAYRLFKAAMSLREGLYNAARVMKSRLRITPKAGTAARGRSDRRAA